MAEFPGYQEYLRREGLDPRRVRVDAALGCVRLDGPVEASMPYWLTGQTLDLIDTFAEDERPWFIWHCEPGPHAAYEAPVDYLKLYQDVEIPPWPNYEWDAAGRNAPHQVKLHADARRLRWQDWADVIRYYYARTTDIDVQLGRIMRHLEERGLADNTVVIFTSDHGQTLGSHGGLVDKGWHHFEETHRIGMIVRDPRCARNGEVATEWASLLDIYPTILDIAGGSYDPERIHGRSLVPVLEGRVADWRDEVFVEFWGVNGLSTTMVTCRAGDLKYGWNAGSWDELYDLAADPYETRNVISEPAYAEYPERPARARDPLDGGHGPSGLAAGARPGTTGALKPARGEADMPKGRPHVILLMADHLRRDSLGCYGDRAVAMPNLDRLAEECVIFDHAYCATPLCTPTRVSMYTGKHAHTHGAIVNGHHYPEEKPFATAGPQHGTLYEALSAAGYGITHVGIQHCQTSPPLEERVPEADIVGWPDTGSTRRSTASSATRGAACRSARAWSGRGAGRAWNSAPGRAGRSSRSTPSTTWTRTSAAWPRSASPGSTRRGHSSSRRSSGRRTRPWSCPSPTTACIRRRTSSCRRRWASGARASRAAC